MRHGAIAILPLALGAAAYGLAFGVLAAQAVFSWFGVAAMSALVHAGSSQIVAVEQLHGGSGTLGAILAGALLNLRYLGVTASLADILRDLPFTRRLIAIHITGDENWALTMAERARNPDVGSGFLIGSGLVMISVWTLSTALGAAIGAAIPDPDAFGLGFAFTAAFIAMARGMWPRHAPAAVRRGAAWTASFLVTLICAYLGMSTAFAIVLGACCGLGVSIVGRIFAERLFMERRK